MDRDAHLLAPRQQEIAMLTATNTNQEKEITMVTHTNTTSAQTRKPR
jgi:hypothetical protein